MYEIPGLNGIPRQFVLDRAVSEMPVSADLLRILSGTRFLSGLRACDEELLSTRERMFRFLSLRSAIQTKGVTSKEYPYEIGKAFCHLGWIINPVEPRESKPWIQLMHSWMIDSSLNPSSHLPIKSVRIGGFSAAQLLTMDSMLTYERQLVEQFIRKKQIQASLRETSRHTYQRGIHAYTLYLAELNQDWDVKKQYDQLFLTLWCWPPFLAGIFTWFWRTGFLTF